MLDYLAWLVVGLTWLFGGAAVIGDGTDYKLDLKQWSGVTLFIVAAAIAVCSVIWAFNRLIG